jgi:hypothetical protein
MMFLLLLILLALPAAAFEAVPALSYQMDDEQGRLLLVDLPPETELSDLRADVRSDHAVLVSGTPVQPGRYPWVGYPADRLPVGTSALRIDLRGPRGPLGTTAVEVTRRPPRANAVQVDRLSGGLVVDGLPFFPVGFYCYSPVQPTLAAEEVVRGFNVISPYQSNDPATIDERRAWMNDVAALGMKAHYQLLRVAGGGGVMGADADTSATRREAWLRAEVEAFREHPALLAWYISDEPTGHGATPEELEAAAAIVRELDPYHPVTIVFVNPGAAGRFRAAMDLAMTDPYPIPNGPPGSIAGAVRTVRDAVAPHIPLWLVPQAFGGNEWWSREPTAAELRLMSWLGVIEGATGTQYFIRHGLNGFPKGPDTWAAASRFALEMQALTPYLLSGQSAPTVRVNEEGLHAAAWRHGDDVLVAVANTHNQPRDLQLTIDGLTWNRADVDVLYEDRVVSVTRASDGGALGLLRRPFSLVGDLLRTEAPEPVPLQLEDVIEGYGIRLYTFATPALPATQAANLLIDPGFEWEAAPSIPAALYADVGDGRGATYFTDPRVAHGGRRSLRLHAPAAGTGVRIRPYAPSATPGRSYRLSVWARAAAEGVVLRLGNGAAGDSLDVALSTDWKEYHLDARVGAATSRAWLSLGLASAGTAWIDDLAFFDISPRIAVTATPTGHSVTLSSPVEEAHLHVSTDGSPVTADSPRYEGPLRTTGSSDVRAALVRDGEVLSRASIELHGHQALGRFVELQHPYSPRYPAAGPGSLADGILGTQRFADGRWQGFEGQDLVAVIDLGRPVRVDSVRARFLQSVPSWIWLPAVMEVNLSDDGRRFRPFATADHDVDARERALVVRQLVARGAPDTARYVRVRARSVGACPDWHPGSGAPAWVFADEILVDGE